MEIKWKSKKPGLWDLQSSKNIEPLLDEEASKNLGNHVFRGYENDKQSRQSWETRMEDANKLALQIVEEKSWPWPNASNVKFPLITIAALQFSARAYPALVKAPEIVKYRVNGADPNGQKASRAARISRHMSYQMLEQDDDWEEDMDKAFVALPILGTVFKKTYFDSSEGINKSCLVLPENLYVNYYAKTLEKCERKTEKFQLYEREIKSRQLKGFYSDVELRNSSQTETSLSDKRQGIAPPPHDSTKPRDIIEQHLYLDLDGDDYPEPYIVTVDETTKKVLRIRSRFEKVETEQSVEIERLVNQGKTLKLQMQVLARQVQQPSGEEGDQELRKIQQIESQIRQLSENLRVISEAIEELNADNKKNPKVLEISAQEYFTKYGFIPSPDGGFYDLGLGALLGPLNMSVNTLLNQLIDSGTLQNSNSGFLGRGSRIKGGRLFFEPGEWKRVDATGAQLRDSIVPLPVNQPSPVLFNLLSLLITYSEKVSSVNAAMTGEDMGQNTPAYNMKAMLEQGLQVFNGIFKRLYRSMRREFKKYYQMNALYMNPIEYFETQDGDFQVLQQDYQGDPKDLYPAADPNAFSNMESLAKAFFLAQRAAQVPGYSPIAVERRLLEANDIPDVQEVYPLDEKGNWVFPPQPNPELVIDEAEERRRTVESQVRMEIMGAETESKMDVDQSVVALNYAKAKELGDKTAIEEFEAITNRLKERRESIKAALELLNAKEDKSGDDN